MQMELQGKQCILLLDVWEINRYFHLWFSLLRLLRLLRLHSLIRLYILHIYLDYLEYLDYLFYLCNLEMGSVDVWSCSFMPSLPSQPAWLERKLWSSFAVQCILVSGCSALLYTRPPHAWQNAPNRPWRDYSTHYGDTTKILGMCAAVSWWR